jgi:hypothetical protein
LNAMIWPYQGEGCEWKAHKAFFESGVKIRQIQIELHSWNAQIT